MNFFRFAAAGSLPANYLVSGFFELVGDHQKGFVDLSVEGGEVKLFHLGMRLFPLLNFEIQGLLKSFSSLGCCGSFYLLSKSEKAQLRVFFGITELGGDNIHLRPLAYIVESLPGLFWKLSYFLPVGEVHGYGDTEVDNSPGASPLTAVAKKIHVVSRTIHAE